MDILRTLNNILSPLGSPANHSRPAVPVTETQAGQRTFAQTLEEASGNDPSIAPFGVTRLRALSALPATPAPITRPQIDALVPGTPNPNAIFNGAGGPTVLPGNPAADGPAQDLPIDQLHIEIGDIGTTLGSTINKQTEILTKPEPLLPPPDDTTPPVVGNAGQKPRGAPMSDDPRLLPPNPGVLAQYEALAGGTTAGANFERFKDAAAHGFFTDDQAGYGRYLQYNSSGATPRLTRPDFCGWMQAADLVYAIRSGAHQGNNQSPVWTGSAAYPFGRAEILSLAAAAKWSPEQRQDALTEYSNTFQRLYSEWVPNGQPLPMLNT